MGSIFFTDNSSGDSSEILCSFRTSQIAQSAQGCVVTYHEVIVVDVGGFGDEESVREKESKCGEDSNGWRSQRHLPLLKHTELKLPFPRLLGSRGHTFRLSLSLYFIARESEQPNITVTCAHRTSKPRRFYLGTPQLQRTTPRTSDEHPPPPIKNGNDPVYRSRRRETLGDRDSAAC